MWRAWRIVHGRWPKLWELVCILIHDIGHWQTDYLNNLQEKRDHWRLGAAVAKKLFGDKGYRLVAGHIDYSEVELSDLYKVDKHSWHIAPFWWLYYNNIVEPKVKCGMSNGNAVRDFKSNIAKMVESGEYHSAHELFIARKKSNKEPR